MAFFIKDSKQKEDKDMKTANHVRISQCMIVKNEERNIERALSWGKPLMWEQIVVDTGSTDHTVEIAQRLGAQVYHFPWIHDFAAAKNYAIEQAKGDWIAFLDADEYMMPEDAGKLAAVIESLEPDRFDGISTGWQQLDGEGRIFASGTQIRFFRNRPDIRYRRRIHEQLESMEGRELRIGDVVASFSIFHTGYQGEAYAEKTKSGRNRQLILEELKEHPEDYEMMGYMGDECLDDGEREEARAWYQRAILHMPPRLSEEDQRSAATYTRLLMLLTEGEGASWDSAEEIYRQAVEHLPKEADFDYIAGRFFAASGNAGQAVHYLEGALGKLNAFGCSNRALLLAGNLMEAYDLLVRCCYEAGESQKCVSYAVACLRADRYAMPVLSRLLLVLTPDNESASQEYPRVLDFFAGLYDFSALKDRLFLIKTAQRTGCKGFAAFAADRLLNQQERAAMGLD